MKFKLQEVFSGRNLSIEVEKDGVAIMNSASGSTIYLRRVDWDKLAPKIGEAFNIVDKCSEFIIDNEIK